MDDAELADLRETVAGYRLAAEPPTAPGCEPHEPQPRGYIAASNWADLMMQTHDQRRCRGCGKWLIWEPKAPAPNG